MPIIRVSPEFSNIVNSVSPLFLKQRDTVLAPLLSARPGALIGLTLVHRWMRQDGGDYERIATFDSLLSLGSDANSLECRPRPQDALLLFGAVLLDYPVPELDGDFGTHEVWRSVHFRSMSIVMAAK